MPVVTALGADAAGAGDGSGSGYGISYGSGSGYGSGYGSSNGYGSGYGTGAGSDTGYGCGSGTGYGYGSGTSYGDGTSHGYGHGDGSGHGYGEGDGYGEGSGHGYGSSYGSGYGTGSGDDYGYGWPLLLEAYRDHPLVVAELAAGRDVLLGWWRSGADGLPVNGGSGGEPARPGLVQEVAGPLKLCRRGLHATAWPQRQTGDRWWVVALSGEIQSNGSKAAALRRVILEEISTGSAVQEWQALAK